MTLEQIIELFDDMERGKTGQRIGFHLHGAIRIAMETPWETNQNYNSTFSGFLRALRNEEMPLPESMCQADRRRESKTV
jgi:Uma2 family endonuclease